jgi:hypothetical protein
VSWVSRHALAVAVVLVAVAATGGVFAFARPTYRPSSPYTLIDMSNQRHYTVAQVRHAFASHGLPINSVTGSGDRESGIIILDQRRGRMAPDWTISLFGPESQVSFGPKLDPKSGYESRFGNVSVLYGDPHPDRAVLARIEAAVADLQR